MKRIVILFDGTWNRSDSETPTNVVRLAQAMEPFDATGIAQVPIYIPGVGSGTGVSKASKLGDKILGGGLGWGLSDRIVEAYRHLVFLYRPGDAIFVFGFSRGAYAARSLAGFIRSTGIVARENLHKVPDAFKRYRRRGDPETHPRNDASNRHRLDLSPQVVTTHEEATWRAERGHPEVPVLNVAYMGLWDTVGGMSGPDRTFAEMLFQNGAVPFHDLDLSSMVASARHAIAIDERRTAFRPTRWSNLRKLNDASGIAPPPYAEMFFAGDHGSVGGGGDITALSSIALGWVIEGAQKAGLEFDMRCVDRIRGEEDGEGPLTNRRTASRSLVDRAIRLSEGDRYGPDDVTELHDAARDRWIGLSKAVPPPPPYRPGALRRIAPQLALMMEEGTEARRA